MYWRNNPLKARLWEHGARAMRTKHSALVPFALAGGLLGGLGAGAASSFGGNPYADPQKDALRGAGAGALGMTAAYGLSRLPAWAVLPGVLAGGTGLYGMSQARTPIMNPQSHQGRGDR
jgi:hypothetical protein